MMLWDLIRDFFVEHITGGTNSLGHVIGVRGGQVDVYIEGVIDDSVSPTTTAIFNLGSTPDGFAYTISMSDWLATTLTIISLIFILVACVMFVVKIIKLVGNLVK